MTTALNVEAKWRRQTFGDLLQSRQHLRKLLLAIGELSSPAEVDTEQRHDRVDDLQQESCWRTITHKTTTGSSQAAWKRPSPRGTSQRQNREARADARLKRDQSSGNFEGYKRENKKLWEPTCVGACVEDVVEHCFLVQIEAISDVTQSVRATEKSHKQFNNECTCTHYSYMYVHLLSLQRVFCVDKHNLPTTVAILTRQLSRNWSQLHWQFNNQLLFT